MQCLNCGFENMPQLPACVRCASRLQLADVAVFPPRASRLRFMTRINQIWNATAGATISLRRIIPRWRPVTFAPIAWRTVFQSLVLPGLGQLRNGQRRLGGMLLSAWGGALLLAIVLLGSPLHSWLIIAAITAHAIALIAPLAIELAFARIWLRLAFGCVVFVTLQQIVYQPIQTFCDHFVQSVRLSRIAPGSLVETGDGVLNEGPWLRPRQFSRGDLVLYRIPSYAGAGFYVQAGFGLDRVTGLPGETVAMKEGRPLINGHPCEGVQPLSAWPRIGDFERKLLPDEYWIVPSQMSVLYHGINVPMPSTVTLIAGQAIEGRVFWRTWPWSRFGRLQ